MATEKTTNAAYKALPILVRLAQTRELITYSKLADNIGEHHRLIPHVLGFIRDELCASNGLPLLNVIVVNKQTRIPGESFLPEGTSKLSDNEYKAKFEEYRDQVFQFAQWDDLLRKYNLTPISKTSEDFIKSGKEHSRLLNRRVSPGEGKAHRQLKEYIRDHPTAIGINEYTKAETEYLFPSGDECDVVFHHDKKEYVVEIKNGYPGELEKGIFQAIKYHALMKAEKGVGEPYPVEAFLVAYRIPQEIQDFANKFDVHCVEIDPQKVPGVDVSTLFQQ